MAWISFLVLVCVAWLPSTLLGRPLSRRGRDRGRVPFAPLVFPALLVALSGAGAAGWCILGLGGSLAAVLSRRFARGGLFPSLLLLGFVSAAWVAVAVQPYSHAPVSDHWPSSSARLLLGLVVPSVPLSLIRFHVPWNQGGVATSR